MPMLVGAPASGTLVTAVIKVHSLNSGSLQVDWGLAVSLILITWGLFLVYILAIELVLLLLVLVTGDIWVRRHL